MTQDMIEMAAIDAEIAAAFRMGLALTDDELEDGALLLPADEAKEMTELMLARLTAKAATENAREMCVTLQNEAFRLEARLDVAQQMRCKLPAGFRSLSFAKYMSLAAEYAAIIKKLKPEVDALRLAAERAAQAKRDARKASEKRYVDLLSEGNSLAGKHGKSERKPIRELSKLTDEALAAATKELEEGVSRLRSLEAKATHKRDQELLRDYNHARLTGKTRLPRALWIEQQLNPGRYYGRAG